MQKKWLVKENASSDFSAAVPTLGALSRQLLWNRGIIDPAAIEEFLRPDYGKHLHDPFLFRDMRKAVDRLFLAIKNKEKIFIFADYDADGISAGTILKTTLEGLGASAGIYLPHRETEGYGLNPNAVTYMKEQGATVVITCDCGISNKSEIALAAEKGIDVIVTDHHQEPKELPDRAFALIHPKLAGETYPFKGLSGGGVAFKLAQALLRAASDLGSIANKDAFEKRLTELAAISSVADMVPLVGESRTLTKFGLLVLNKTTRVGLKKLYETAGIVPGRVDTYTIGFQIAPRVNAGGRMDHANSAFALLNENDDAEASRFALALNNLNTERQRATVTMVGEAREQVFATNQDMAPVLILFDARWAAGLVGLVAGKIVEEFNRPVFVFTQKHTGEYVASARSIPAFNVITAMQSMPESFLRFGGHPQAAGMSVAPEAFEAFKEKMVTYAGSELAGKDLTPILSIDAELSIDAIDWKLQEEIAAFEPFGMQNFTPRFVSRGLVVKDIAPVGSEGKHLRLSVASGAGKICKCIAFGFGEWIDRLKLGDRVDLVYEITVNEWNGNRELQLRVVDMTISS